MMSWHRVKNRTQTGHPISGLRVVQGIVLFKPVSSTVPLFYTSLLTAVVVLFWGKTQVGLMSYIFFSGVFSWLGRPITFIMSVGRDCKTSGPSFDVRDWDIGNTSHPLTLFLLSWCRAGPTAFSWWSALPMLMSGSTSTLSVVVAVV